MNSIKKQTSRSFWLAGLLLTSLIAGCNNSDNGSNTTPIASSTGPTDAATTVALNSKVVATFSEDMDAATLTSQSFTVTGEGEAAVPGTVTYDAASKTASFTASRNFTADKLHTATLTTAVRSAAGFPLAKAHSWSFTSGPTPDLTAPTASATDPVDGTIDIALNRSLTTTFNEALDPATISTSTFTLSDGSAAVSGTVSYSNRVATFNPALDLTGGTLYTATLTTAITDLAGNALAAKSWSFTTGINVAAGPAPVNLRTAGDFVILSKTGITNVHSSAITGNIGASPITAAAMDTVFCSEITGTIYGSDAGYTGSGAITCFAGAAPDNTLVANAVLDMGTAYADAAGRTTPDFTELGAGDISGLTLAPGLYKWGTGVLISTDVTLSGGANDVWIFQVAGDVTQADASSILLAGGALPKNIFWQVGGGTGVAIGTDAAFEGVVLAEKGITVNSRSTVNGRLLSQTAVTLNMNTVTQPAP